MEQLHEQFKHNFLCHNGNCPMVGTPERVYDIATACWVLFNISINNDIKLELYNYVIGRNEINAPPATTMLYLVLSPGMKLLQVFHNTFFFSWNLGELSEVRGCWSQVLIRKLSCCEQESQTTSNIYSLVLKDNTTVWSKGLLYIHNFFKQQNITWKTTNIEF